ncbi:MAG: hypothetical protein ABW067_17385 [Rhizobacter sp.]
MITVSYRIPGQPFEQVHVHAFERETGLHVETDADGMVFVTANDGEIILAAVNRECFIVAIEEPPYDDITALAEAAGVIPQEDPDLRRNVHSLLGTLGERIVATRPVHVEESPARPFPTLAPPCDPEPGTEAHDAITGTTKEDDDA